MKKFNEKRFDAHTEEKIKEVEMRRKTTPFGPFLPTETVIRRMAKSLKKHIMKK